MNRRLTGLLAWCALGAIVAIPSADVILKNTGNDDAARVMQGADATRYGPDTAKQEKRPTIDLSATDLSGVLQPQLEEAEELPTAVAEVEAEAPTPSVSVLPPIVPARAAVEKLAPVEEQKTVAVAEAEAEPEQDLPPAAPLIEPAPLDLASSEDGDTPKVDTPEAVVKEPLVVAAIEPVEAPVVEIKDAPVPMPADMRPKKVVTQQAVKTEDLRPRPQVEEQVRSSVNVIETARRPRLQFKEPVNAPFWGDNPNARNGQRLDSFPSAEIKRSDDASDSPFYELWASENRPAGFQRRGSFSEQLPARRGSAIRLDLLQNR